MYIYIYSIPRVLQCFVYSLFSDEVDVEAVLYLNLELIFSVKSSSFFSVIKIYIIYRLNILRIKN